MAEKKGFFAEFKEFATKGNVMDLAVGVIVGGAFSTITNSLVNDVVMPVVSMFLGGINFADWKITLPQLFGTPAADAAPITLNYGTFISTIINFLILAMVVFCIVKAMNKARASAEERLKKEEEEAAAAAEEAPAEDPAPTAEQLLAEILEELRKQ